MGKIRELSEQLLRGEGAAFHPFTPQFAAEEIAERAAFVSSFANVLALDSGDGLVLVDVGSFFFARLTKELVRGVFPARLHTAIYTHGHVDHVFGVELYEAEDKGPVRVIAQRALPERFERYRLTAGYNACINARQFQVKTEWPVDYRFPDELFDEQLSVQVGDLDIELRHARGETDDHLYAWVPSRKLLATGDLFIWACPNAGNPQKVQRYPGDWARALRAMAGLDAELLSPGHGPPIFGAEPVRRALLETAELLEHLVRETLARMNDGATADQILGAVTAPKELLERPYLRPIYDEPEFIVRNVMRQFGGWWDGNPAHLKPARERDLADELCALAGGTGKLATRALERSAAGEHALASHLIEIAYASSGCDNATRSARVKVYSARADAELSLMAKGVFGSAARESEPE